MKLGVVCYPTYGGSGVVATELAQAMALRGHEVHLVSYAPPARLDPYVSGLVLHEVAVSSYPLFKYPPYDVALASRLAEVAEDAGLDVVHAHYAIPHAVAGLTVKEILRPRALPLVTTLHGTDITVVGQEPSYVRVLQWALERSDAVTAVSSWLVDETRRALGVDRPIEVIPNFVDTERFRPHPESQARTCFARGDGHVWMHVSNFRPVKQSPWVVDLFAHAAADGQDVLVMVGDGPERRECEARARAAGVADRVRFLGNQADVAHLLPAADLFLLPSRFESFGLAALEAMACGVVPVGLAGGGLPEVVTGTDDGLLLDPDADVAAAAEAVRALLQDGPRLAATKAAARARAETAFGRAPVVDRYEALLEGLVPRA